MLRVAVPALALVVLAPACSGDDAATTASSSTTAQFLDEPDIPDDLNPEADPAQFQIAQAVSIEEGTLVPVRLIAIVGNEITFTNNTGADAEITFRNAPIDAEGNRSSGPIPPGGTFSHTPETIRNITYEINGTPEWRGSIQVDTGEDD